VERAAVSREPLFSMMLKLRKMKLADQCVYLIACIKAEAGDTSRRRELQKMLVDRRTAQIKQELRKDNSHG
jgi:hypothetical protein